ncbi:ATP-binding protein [Streptomyces sp. NBC_01750]|uniref:ATP-binding protein n=1 Tax=Streptomyces sp. NBC_01750 TaxID=2975928 RepID=UPI002DD99F11|nr:ATP-binding protein [Streptomyces sp. NBC_01750]
MDRTAPRASRTRGTIADTASAGPQRSALSAPSGAVDAPLAANCVESFVAGPWPLPWSPTACGVARAAIRNVLPRWGVSELVPTAELLASELVCNALRHAVGPLRLTLERVSGLRCQVSDGSSEPPCPTDSGPEDEDGRGLALVDMLAARWGYEYGAVGKSVWFELSVDVDTADLDGRHTPWIGETDLHGLDALKSEAV